MLAALVDEGIEYALALIGKRHESRHNPECFLPFHGREHTRAVIRRAHRFAVAMRLPEKERHMACLAAAFHDVVQRWSVMSAPDGALLRSFLEAENKELSAQEMRHWLAHHPDTEFSHAELALLSEAVATTETQWNAALRTFTHPRLGHNSAPLVRLVAIADLGTAGTDPQAYLDEGDRDFRERNLDVGAAIRSVPIRMGVPAKNQEAFRGRMLAHGRCWVYNAAGRKAQLEPELGNLATRMKEPLRHLLHAFDESAALAEIRAEHRKDMTFWELAEAMGYRVPRP